MLIYSSIDEFTYRKLTSDSGQISGPPLRGSL